MSIIKASGTTEINTATSVTTFGGDGNFFIGAHTRDGTVLAGKVSYTPRTSRHIRTRRTGSRITTRVATCGRYSCGYVEKTCCIVAFGCNSTTVKTRRQAPYTSRISQAI